MLEGIAVVDAKSHRYIDGHKAELFKTDAGLI